MKLAISPCPNDTFAFYALINGRVDKSDLDFEVQFADIDQLNCIAIDGSADICKVSAAVVSKLQGYTLLDSGAAIGYGNAPLLVARNGFKKPLSDSIVAVPGLDTTACALLHKFFPEVKQIVVALFSDIMPMIERGEVDAGVVIHEGRFVYAELGLDLVADFGKLWENHFNMPVPLGCIVAKSSLGEEVIKEVETLIRQSVQYGLSNRDEPMNFVGTHAAELDLDVQKKHIDYFVNDFTISMGDLGRNAISTLAK